MFRRPLAALATSLSAFAAVLVPLAGTAHAEGTCTLTPPARIAIYADHTELPANISGACVPTGFGYWFTPGDLAKANFADAVFDATLDEPPAIHVPDVLSRYGLQTWEAEGAGSTTDCGDAEGSTPSARFTRARAFARAEADCYDLTQNQPSSDIRLGTYGAIAGTRNSANKITFTVTSAIWSTGLDNLINRSMKGTLQTQYADGTWHNVGNTITTGSNGKSTFAVGLPRRTWRFAVYSTPYAFNRVSTPITR